MPFLLPALIAVICDICVIWLSSYTPHHDTTTGTSSDSGNSNDTIDNNRNDNNDYWVYYTIDLYCGSIAAILRLCILCIPLLYHSYTGTAIRYTLWYRTIYIGMALLVALHVTSYIIIQPESIESLIILPTTDPQYEYRRLWLILLLSSISLIFHSVLLRHVRSTAPTHPMMLRMLNHRQMDVNAMSKNPRKSSYYFLCGNYINNAVQPTMYFAVRTAAAAAAAAASAATSTTTSTSTHSIPKILTGTNTTSINTNLSILPNLPLSDYRNVEDENDNGGIEQEPALINAMNGAFIVSVRISPVTKCFLSKDIITHSFLLFFM